MVNGQHPFSSVHHLNNCLMTIRWHYEVSSASLHHSEKKKGHFLIMPNSHHTYTLKTNAGICHSSVSINHVNYLHLHFLWHKDSRLENTRTRVTYRMRVHIFGNRPPPSVALYNLQRIAELSGEKTAFAWSQRVHSEWLLCWRWSEILSLRRGSNSI